LVDREVFDRRLARLEELLRDLRRLSRSGREPYLGDRGLQAQAERWLQLAAECVLDLANHLISERGWRTPETYRDSIRVLAEEGVLPGDLAPRLEAWAGLRNILVHLYLEVDHETLWRVLTEDLGDLEAFAAAVASAAGQG
jgi:uncharacterized protein YutE (UPF0331/DUF86 family)